MSRLAASVEYAHVFDSEMSTNLNTVVRIPRKKQLTQLRSIIVNILVTAARF